MPELAGWLNWLTGQQVPALDHVTQDHCDRYLAERRRKDNAGQVIGTLSAGTLQAVAAVIIELGAYAELFTADRYRDGFTPWQGRTASQVAGFRSGGENKTPPVDQQLLQPLLAAAFYLTGTLGPHVLALRDSVRDARLASAGLRTARAGRDELDKVLQHHLDHSEPLVSVGVRTISRRLGEGWAADDPLLPVSYQALARAAGAKRLDPHALADARPAIVAVLGKVGSGQALGTGRRRGHQRGRRRQPSVDAAAGHPGPAGHDRPAPHILPGDHLGGDRDAFQRADGTAVRMPARHRHLRRHDPLPAGGQAHQRPGPGRHRR